QLWKETYPIAEIQSNSSAKFSDVAWDINQSVNDRFHITLSLLDEQDQEISVNEYLLLIGDHEQATKRMHLMGEALHKNAREYTYGNYYRFYPDMIKSGGSDWQTEEDIPRARGFENKAD
ncbi:unnamed protein product, partial [marine sediment metagenome]